MEIGSSALQFANLFADSDWWAGRILSMWPEDQMVGLPQIDEFSRRGGGENKQCFRFSLRCPVSVFAP